MSDVNPTLRGIVLVIAVALVLAIAMGPVGVAVADTGVTLELDAAAAEQTATGQISFTITASGNGTIDVESSESVDGGYVTFDFDGWQDLDSAASGSSSSWSADDGHEYRVYYKVTAESTGVGEFSGASDGTHYASLSVSHPDGSSESRSVSATVEYLHPQFGGIADKSSQVIFRSSGDETSSISVAIDNIGEGLLKPDQVTFGFVPSGLDPSVSGLDDSISAGGTGHFSLDITVDSSISEGSYDFTATVEDNLGNTESFDVTLDVSKPPEADVPGGIDFGDIFVGEAETQTFEVCEANGFSAIENGISASVSPGSEGDDFGSIVFDDLADVSMAAGSCDQGTAQVSVSIDEGVEQHRQLEWTVNLEPRNEPLAQTDQVRVTARAIQHAEFDQFRLEEQEIRFTRPKSEVNEHTIRTDIEVSNTGHPTVTDIDVSASSSGFSVDTVDGPSRIMGHDSDTFEVVIAADADLDEGTYPVEIEVSGTEEGTNRLFSRTFTREIEVIHQPKLGINRTELKFGESRRLERLTRQTQIREVLEYESIDGLSVQQVSGPDQWLTIADAPPVSIEPGGAESIVFALEFDTQASPLQLYTWTFEVSGRGVEPQTITVSARAKSGIEPVLQNVSRECETQGWDDVACPMAEELNTLKTQLRSGENIPQREVSASVSAGRSLVVFVSAAEQARTAIEAGDHERAQQHVIRMLAAYNLLEVHGSRIRTADLQPLVRQTVQGAREHQETIVADQVTYLESQRESDNSTALMRATINRDLARLRFLQGQGTDAEQLRSASAEAFNDYDALITSATERRQDADQLWTETKESMLVMVFGRPLMLNPAGWDAFHDRRQALLEMYEQSTDEYRQAGAPVEATDTAEKRSQVASQLQFARNSLYISTGVYGVLFVGIITRLGWGSYTYIRDGREAATGDFLVG